MHNFNDIYERLLNYANNMKIIDTHEHLHPQGNYLGEQPDVLCDYFSHYITTDLMSAGMPEEDLNKVKDYKIDIIERFRILEPYLDCVKNTSYYRSLEIAAKKIHKINEISVKTIEELNEKFKKAASQENYGRGGQGNRIYSVHSKTICLMGNGGGRGGQVGIYKIDLPDGNYIVRKLTPIEAERAQTLPDNYTALGVDDNGKTVNISNTQRYKCIGNGWTVNTVAHILSLADWGDFPT